MSVDDKILQLKQDFDDVHNKGYEDGKNSVVRLEQYADNIRFTNLNLFGKEEVVLNLDNATSLESLYSPNLNSGNKTVKHITVNCPNKISSLRSSFSGSAIYDNLLECITLNVDTSLCEWWINSFFRMTGLKVIDGTPLNPIKCNNNGFTATFGLCNELQEVRFVANSILQSISFPSSKLSTDTIQSIIDGLADLTGGTAQTLTVHSNVYQKIIDNGWDALITAKNWTLVSA